MPLSPTSSGSSLTPSSAAPSSTGTAESSRGAILWRGTLAELVHLRKPHHLNAAGSAVLAHRRLAWQIGYQSGPGSDHVSPPRDLVRPRPYLHHGRHRPVAGDGGPAAVPGVIW